MTQKTPIPGYTLTRAIGRGNTSLVYLALDAAGREVALKVPHPVTLKVQEAAERFVDAVLGERGGEVVHGEGCARFVLGGDGMEC